MFIENTEDLSDLEADIIISKELMMYLLIDGHQMPELERLMLINELLNVTLDDDDFGEDEISPSFYLMDEYNLLLSEGEYDKFIEAIMAITQAIANSFKKQLLEREKYEFLHELDL